MRHIGSVREAAGSCCTNAVSVAANTRRSRRTFSDADETCQFIRKKLHLMKISCAGKQNIIYGLVLSAFLCSWSGNTDLVPMPSGHVHGSTKRKLWTCWLLTSRISSAYVRDIHVFDWCKGVYRFVEFAGAGVGVLSCCKISLIIKMQRYSTWEYIRIKRSLRRERSRSWRQTKR